MSRSHKLFIALLLVAVPFMGTLRGHAAEPNRWEHFRSRASGNAIVIKTACWGGEDSLSHLRLLAIRDHHTKVVLGCHHRGY